MKPLQLSDVLFVGRYAGQRVEDIIESKPLHMDELVNTRQVLLAAGAARYLRECLAEWHEHEDVWQGGYEL